MDTIMEKLSSRKFWFALAGAMLPIVAQGLTGEVGWEEACMLSVGVLMSYIIGQGYVDGQTAAAITSEE